MTKKFFTKVSPKAAGGIRRVYESKGYEVRAKIQTDGSVTVVAARNDGRDARAGKLSGRKKGHQMEGVSA